MSTRTSFAVQIEFAQVKSLTEQYLQRPHLKVCARFRPAIHRHGLPDANWFAQQRGKACTCGWPFK
jgi:hypothetical protein